MPLSRWGGKPSFTNKGDDKLWEWFNKLTENHQISYNKKFFAAAVNGRYKNYTEDQDNFNICR